MDQNESAEKRNLITLEQWQSGGNYYSCNGYNIFYRTNNSDKPTLLLIHGFPTSSWDFSYLWEELGQYFNLLAIDLLGFGLSDKPFNHQYSTSEQADFIEALLQQQNIQSFHILAHDYGDTVTQEMIARHDGQKSPTGFTILSACLLNGGLFPESHSHTFLQGLLAGKWGGLVRLFLTRQRVYKALSGLFGQSHKPSATELDILWRLIACNRGDQISHKLLHYIKERKQFRSRWVGALQKTSIALRLINGPDDPVSGMNMVENYRKNINNPDIILLDGVGHFPHLEVPGKVLKAYMDFYQRITS